MVAREDIRRGLEKLGLTAGDTVVVHSSLSSFGEVEGGADTVVDALLDVLGDEGTLVVPVFNYAPGVFDPQETPSLLGAITEAVRLRPDAVRSLHPTHSVAAIGRLADVITENHEKASPFGRGSALFKVLQANGKILQLGVTHTSNSMVHVAEELAGVPYLERSRQVGVRTPSGKVVQKTVRRPGCSRGFNVIEEPLRQRGAIGEAAIGDCRARLMTARAVVDAATELLKLDLALLLCERPDCEVCAESRAMIDASAAEARDKEIIELVEQDERTLRIIERQLGTTVDTFEPGDNHYSPN